MAGMDWFRWHHGSVTDPKFQLVARKSGASVAEVLAVWACVLEAASQAEHRGNPGEIDFEALDCALGLDEGKSLAIYGRMNERGMFTEDGTVTAWEKRQPKREREDDKSTDRVKAFRERQRHETPRNANETAETPREEKSREEEKKERLSDAVASGAAAPSTRQLPDQPTDRDMVFALGVPLLTAAGVSEKNARSMLAGLSKAHGEAAVHTAIRTTATNGAGEPVGYLQRILGKGAGRPNPQEALEANNREVARRWAEGNPHATA